MTGLKYRVARALALAITGLALSGCFGDDDTLRPSAGVDRQTRTASLFGGMMSPDLFAEPSQVMPAAERIVHR